VKFNLVDSWIDNVAYSHSRNANTGYHYKHSLKMFCDFIETSPEQNSEEYEKSSDRDFKRKYASYVRALISSLSPKYAVGTVSEIVVAIRSFFKYNDLPLGHIPSARRKVTYHNRDIKKGEITEILSISSVRDRAFFCLMTQSGLRPVTLCRLRLKHIQPDFDKGVIPCRIEVPQELAKGEYHAYFTFMGEEALNRLRDYLKTRGKMNPEDYLFTLQGKDTEMSPKSPSHSFRNKITKLKQKGIMDFREDQKGKPSDIRLYNLRKWFRKQAGHAGPDYTNFWMGHSLGVDEHYFSHDVEMHRKQYAEKAMPFLRLENATPTDTEKIMQTQAEEIKRLKAKLNNYDIVIREQVEDTVEKLRRELYDVPFTKSGFSKPEFRKAVKAMIEEIFEETAMIKELLKEKKAQNHNHIIAEKKE